MQIIAQQQILIDGGIIEPSSIKASMDASSSWRFIGDGIKRTFSQILFEDESMPFQDCDDDLIGECSQSFLENSQFFEDLMQNFQSGGGGISDAEVVDLNDAVIVLEKSRRKNKNIKLKNTCKKDATAISAMKNRNRPALKKRAQELHEAAGVPLGPCTFQEVQIFEDHLNIQIVVFSADNLNQVTYKGKERPLRINLWHHDNHYDVIKSVKGFFGSNYYCENCEKPYSSW
ncbi:uncharacterized protein CEXT_10191 [Caerostris extrusa]|uniref:OTU domain-containing protein n=1 Tax=Caerostris extrusa TaxID=172846 RepID=A0AAV4WN49_CAEEX|nr:uncharacterized protein CEXT_10191 [Caerostris extrusa]